MRNQEDTVTTQPERLADTAALNAIQWMLRDPDWGVGMLEDIAELVRRTGRDVANLPDPDDPAAEGLATWARH